MARRALFLLAVLIALPACESRDVTTDLKIVNVQTGWADTGLVEGGMNKLVPSVSLKLQNVSTRDISSVQVNGVFKLVGDDKTWGDHFVRAIDSNGLRAGASTAAIVLRSPRGYTGSEARLTMLKNSQFVDARVEVFGKHGRRTWAKMGEFPIERRLLTDSGR